MESRPHNSLILAIETSCDETSAAVVRDGRQVLSNIVSSQIVLHQPYGGVVPEIASRRHVQVITEVVTRTLREAGVEQEDLSAIAVTYGPGLAGALLVGLNFAQGMALGLNIPLVPVNHLEGHLYSVWLSRDSTPAPAPQLPLLALIVSGGHTQLVLMSNHADHEVVGRTLDDAAGEAFDKVARLLGLTYPGGPSIERAAQAAEQPKTLPRAWLRGTYDFSFSGLKTAVLHVVYEMATGMSPNETRGVGLPDVDATQHLSSVQVADIAAGFQESVVDVLVRKTALAAQALGVKSVSVVGGVAANRLLHERMREAISLPLYVAAPEFSTDNAAMIAAAAYFSPKINADVDVEPSLALTNV